MSISRHISPITPFRSPEPDILRPAKRQRLEHGYASNGYESPDELAPSLPGSPTAPRPRPADKRTGRPPTNIGSRAQEQDRIESGEESPDELDHTFFLRRGSSNGQPPQATSDVSDTADSETGFQPSSPAPSQPPEARQLEFHYKPKLILRGHKRGVAAVKFSPDGKWIASCCKPTKLSPWCSGTNAHF